MVQGWIADDPIHDNVICTACARTHWVNPKTGKVWVPTRNRGVSFEDCLRRAAECLRMEHEVSDLTNKKLLLEMAQTWVKLAELERAKKSNDNN